MRLPPYLIEAVQAESDPLERRSLAQAVAQLSQRYKAGESSSPVVTSDVQRAAYLSVRLPATYAAVRRMFAETRRRSPETEVVSLLDLGAGPGTALLAASEEFPALRQATLLEIDDRWIALGKSLAGKSPLPAVRQAQWVKQDLRSGFACHPHDLVVISYALVELSAVVAEAVIRRAWTCAQKFLAVIEPGTPRGFAVVNAARSLLIAAGAEILAPCPHKKACPMAAAGDWCHFSQRLERTSLHRQLKSGALGYEDEKFSYLVAGRHSQGAPEARILRHPGKHSGHIALQLCLPAGNLERVTVTRSAKQAYRLARKAEWGETWTG
jgi:ribosomal protein RSM22 (predicted rRNA methylase)